MCTGPRQKDMRIRVLTSAALWPLACVVSHTLAPGLCVFLAALWSLACVVSHTLVLGLCDSSGCALAPGLRGLSRFGP